MPILFPLWQIERPEYDAICRYLGLSPSGALYERLSIYLANAPFAFSSPEGFWRFLGEPRLTRFRIARMDFLTKAACPEHPIRHALNGVVALHECAAEGYREMAASPVGWTVVPALMMWSVAFAGRLAVTVPWLAWQSVRYLVQSSGGGSLTGRNVLVTGASRGLGHDIVLECLERGAKVLAVVRNAASADAMRSRLPAQAPVSFVVADLGVPGSLVEALQSARIQPHSIDVAILCAGTKHDGQSVLELSRLRDTFEVNCFAAVELTAWWCQAAPANDAPRRLVLISSIGRWHGMHATAGYNASKAALSIWGESLDMELRSVRPGAMTVTIVEPGMFQSDMTATSGLAKRLSIPRRRLAARIVSAAMAGRKSLRPPLWFTLVTWGICLAGRDFRYRLLSRVKPGKQ